MCEGKTQSVKVIWWLTLTAIAVTTCGAQLQDHDQEQPGVQPQEVEIIKQINRVNDDGSYTFGYEAADGSFKIETRDVMGNVKGMFGFIDETGELKRVSYTANNGTGFKASGNINNIGDKPLALSGYTTISPGEEETRRPVFVLRQPDPTRGPVIQHIPRRRAHLASSSTTTPSYGEYIRGRRPHIVLPSRSEDITSTTPQVTEEPNGDEPTQIPLRKLVTERPPGKGGNNLRRQLGNEPDAPSGDVADVYSGGAAIPRFIPSQSIRSPQSPLLANLPPHVASAIRQQQIARAAAAAVRPYRPPDDYPTSAPRVSVVDEQEYPIVRGGRNFPPPVRAFYRPSNDDGPSQIPFPMASLRSLRDELMDYILQYLQFRLNGGNPYLLNQYSPQFQNPNINPSYPYQNPIYQGVNPNLYNPYFYSNPPFPRGPYPPVGYPPAGYPPVGYPGQNFPQPLPFSSPNKQQGAQQYGPSQRSAPTYEQFTPSQRVAPAGYEHVETRGSSDQNTYTLPPGDVLRMMLARGLAGSQTTTTAAPTTAPRRSVQILGAASSLSTTTVRPPAPVDEMEMQA